MDKSTSGRRRRAERIFTADFQNGLIEVFLIKHNKPECDTVRLRLSKVGSRVTTLDLAADEALYITYGLWKAVLLLLATNVEIVRQLQVKEVDDVHKE